MWSKQAFSLSFQADIWGQWYRPDLVGPLLVIRSCKFEHPQGSSIWQTGYEEILLDVGHINENKLATSEFL